MGEKDLDKSAYYMREALTCRDGGKRQRAESHPCRFIYYLEREKAYVIAQKGNTTDVNQMT
jgi:hypothetical protein